MSAFSISELFLPPPTDAGAGFAIFACSGVVLRMDQAITGIGGGLETSLTRRFRFCTVAISKELILGTAQSTQSEPRKCQIALRFP